jgi:hypothetical protein
MYTPLPASALAAVAHVVHGDPKQLFSFRLEGEELNQMAAVAESYLCTQLERGFSTLDYYKSLYLENDSTRSFITAASTVFIFVYLFSYIRGLSYVQQN